MDMTYFWEILWGVVGTVVTGLATWLTTRLVAWLNTKIKDQKAAKIATDLANIIMSAVQAVSQSFVDTLKKNGKFDEAAQKEAKEKAYNIIMGELTEELKEYVLANFGDIKEYVMNQIEAMLFILKK